MKLLYLLLISLLLSSHLSAQIPIIDVCTVPGWGQSFAFEDIDSSAHYIVLDTSSNNIWQRGISNKPVLNSGFNGNVLITDTVSSYPVNNTSVFEFAVFICSYNDAAWGSYVGMDISINHNVYSYTNIDGGMIEVKHGMNGNWMNIIDDNTVGFNVFNFYSINDTVQALGQPGFSGNVNGGSSIFYSGPQNSDTLYFRFTFKSDSIPTSYDGWMISSINVGGTFWSIDEHLINSTISIYPNPAKESIQIEAPEITEGTLQIHDLSGRLVLEEQLISGASTIHVGSLSPGNYVIRYFNSEKVAYGRVTIQR
jgi:hypothetical protein